MIYKSDLTITPQFCDLFGSLFDYVGGFAGDLGLNLSSSTGSDICDTIGNTDIQSVASIHMEFLLGNFFVVKMKTFFRA